MRASDLKHITPDAWTQNHNSNLNFPVQSKAIFSVDVFLWKELRQHSKLRQPQICMTMCKRIQRELWQAWSRNLHFAAFTITSHYGTKKCRKTTVPQTEIGKVRVHSSRPRLNSVFINWCKASGQQNPKIQNTEREESKWRSNELLICPENLNILNNSGPFWRACLLCHLVKTMHYSLENQMSGWGGNYSLLPKQKIPDLYYTKWPSSRIKDTINYFKLWCTVHKTYHHA